MNQTKRWLVVGNTAEIYESCLVPAILAPWARYLVRLAELQPGERVLDVACGTGVVSRLAAQHVSPNGKVVGVDINPRMLSVARSLPYTSGVAVAWVGASALALPFLGKAFDVGFCQQGLQFFPDRPTALREMRRVMVPAGRLLLSVWRPIQYCPAFAILTDVLEEKVSAEVAATRRSAFALGDAEELRALIVGAGFRHVDIQAEVRTAHFASPDEFVRAQLTGASVGKVVIDDDILDATICNVSARLRPYVDRTGLAFPMEAYVAVAHV